MAAMAFSDYNNPGILLFIPLVNRFLSQHLFRSGVPGARARTTSRRVGGLPLHEAHLGRKTETGQVFRHKYAMPMGEAW